MGDNRIGTDPSMARIPGADMTVKKNIHLRTRPDNATAKPAECGATMKTTLYDIPPEGGSWDGEVCDECIARRRARVRGIGALK